MKKIIVLYGRANCGKSETIKNVFKILNSNYPTAMVDIIFSGSDIKILMKNLKGLTVGIESQGDPNSRLDQSLQDFQNAQCDIIICTSRTRGMTVNWINSLANSFQIGWIRKISTKSSSQQSANNKSDAQILIQKASL